MLHSALLVMNAYEDGFRTGYGGPPNNLSESDRIDWRRGQSDAAWQRNDNYEREARLAAEEKANPTYGGGGPGAIAVLGGLAVWVLICCDLLGLVLLLMALGLIGWLLVKKKGKWVAYGLLVGGLLVGMYAFSSWVRRGMERRAIQAEREQRREEYAQQIIIMHRADSILRVNRAKYPSLRANRAKQHSQEKATKPHHSSKLTLAEALETE